MVIVAPVSVIETFQYKYSPAQCFNVNPSNVSLLNLIIEIFGSATEAFLSNCKMITCEGTG